MPTTNAVGPHYGSSIGYVQPNGVHRLAGGADIKQFTLNNGSASVAAGNGDLKLEWRADGALVGGRWGVYVAGSTSGPWYLVGEIEYRNGSRNPPTFNSATTRKASKTNVPVQYDQLNVPNATLALIDGGASIYLRFEPRDGVGLILSASELTYTS